MLIAASIPLLRRQESRRSAASRMDWAGAALLAAALTALTLCLGAAARGATPFSVSLLAAGCLLAGAAFLLWETRAPDPLLDLGFFRNRAFTRPLVGMMLA